MRNLWRILASFVFLAPLGFTAPRSPLHAVPHVFIIVMENKDPGEIIGSRNAPYITSSARRYGFAANYYGVTHPSLPNYVSSIAGDFFNTYDDWNGYRFS